MSVLFSAVAILGVAVLAGVRGRTAGILVSVLFAGLIAFFLMPPVLSIRIVRPVDWITMGGYAVTSSFVAAFAGRSSRPHALNENVGVEDYPRSLLRAISTASESIPIIKIVESAERKRLSEVSHPNPVTAEVIAGVLRIALERSPHPYRISVHPGMQPGRRRYWIVVQHQPDPVLPYSRTIGLRDDACQPIHQPKWPRDSSVTWFDNGFEHIYQVSLRA